jgi:RimJ/RimL family protein N-acetyltransferase
MEGARACLGYVFEVLELERIISFTVLENAASQRVMEKCGLMQQGETRWRGLDHVWHALDRWYWEAAEN